MTQADTRIIIFSTALILMFGMFSSLLISRTAATEAENPWPTGSWACTADAKICPDGSAVGRIPPYCHFAPCN